MGGILSSFLGGGGEAAEVESSASGVMSFHSTSRWQLHFNSIEKSPKLEVSQEFKVRGMPAFVLLKKGKEVDRVVGAKKDELERKVVKYRSDS